MFCDRTDVAIGYIHQTLYSRALTAMLEHQKTREFSIVKGITLK